jgi:hypothetical protein
MSFKSAVIIVVLGLGLATGIGAEDLHVPFQLKRNVVIISTSINDSDPLDLILDTGMGFDGVYLFNDKILKTIDITRVIQVQVPGAGSGEASKALMIEDGTLAFGEVAIDSQRVIISTSEFTQSFPSDGVIGWNLFGHYIVGIDYDSEMITLFSENFAEPDSSWQVIPITLKSNLPFLEGKVEVIDGESVDVTLYIDLASDKALELLIKSDQKYTLPDSLKPSYLGTGLSGDIHGSLGKSQRLWLGGWMLAEIPTAFAPAEVRSRQQGADGILGNDCIRRFNMTFDYPHNRLYIKPSKYFLQAFEVPAP